MSKHSDPAAAKPLTLLEAIDDDRPDWRSILALINNKKYKNINDRGEDGNSALVKLVLKHGQPHVVKDLLKREDLEPTETEISLLERRAALLTKENLKMEDPEFSKLTTDKENKGLDHSIWKEFKQPIHDTGRIAINTGTFRKTPITKYSPDIMSAILCRAVLISLEAREKTKVEDSMASGPKEEGKRPLPPDIEIDNSEEHENKKPRPPSPEPTDPSASQASPTLDPSATPHK